MEQPIKTSPDCIGYEWDGPEDPDEEVECLIKYKNKWERENNVKYSKNGIISLVESMVTNECS